MTPNSLGEGSSMNRQQVEARLKWWDTTYTIASFGNPPEESEMGRWAKMAAENRLALGWCLRQLDNPVPPQVSHDS